MYLSKFALLLVGVAIVAGCATHAPQPKAVKPVSVQKTAPIVTFDSSLTAKVISYNQAAQYVVLSFPSSQMPSVNETLFLYRNGLKTAELKVTGPKSDNNIVADVVTGDVQVGDEVRDQ